MHYVLLLSLLASGLLGLPFGAAAPLPSSNTLSLKERTLKLLHSERELSSPTPSATVHSPSFKRGLLFPPSVVTSIATSPITPAVAKTRQEHVPTEASPRMAKRSEGTPRLTQRLQQGSGTEKRSPTTPGEEPRAWSGLDSRSADIDNNDSIVAVRANSPSTPDSAKDPEYNKKNGYWMPWLPAYYILVTVAAVFAAILLIVIVIGIMGGRGTLDYLATWPLCVQNCCAGKAAKNRAKAAGKAAKIAAVTPA